MIVRKLKMKSVLRVLLLPLLLLHGAGGAAELFPLSDVRLTGGPFLQAQETDLAYLLRLDQQRLLAPFLREAGLPLAKESYGNWESSGLDGHMGGHYLSALAMMAAASGDVRVRQRLAEVVAVLKRCQQANGNGYLGGIPGGKAAWDALARGEVVADAFSFNGKWVPWYNLHKVFAGLRDAYQIGGNEDARAMLISLADWAVSVTAQLTPEQMQDMLRSEHGGMNEVLADVYKISGQQGHLDLALRFSHQAVLQPLLAGRDALTGLHANTQIPKVIGFQRLAALAGKPEWQRAARYFWDTVRTHRSVAIGGNSVKEHFHDDKDFSSMIGEVEGPETCNTYNMLKLTELLFMAAPSVSYADYYERALYNHILSSQRPGSGGFVYFTPMRPNHYRVYSQADKGMWCCVGSGLESQAKYGQFIYAHEQDALYVNLFVDSTLYWRERGVRVTQATAFPDQDRSRITIDGDGVFAVKVRYPQWVARGALTLRVNGVAHAVTARPGHYISVKRHWRRGDRIDLVVPMHTALEQMPDKSHYYAVLHGPIVLAAKTTPFAGEQLNYFADDSRMGHIAQGPVCAPEAAPVFVSDTRNVARRFKPVPGMPLTFVAPGLVRGAAADATRFIPFFRLHDARYMLYWPMSTPSELPGLLARTAAAGAARLALDARTLDQVAPGQQQPETDHLFRGEGSEAGLSDGLHWRHASAWFEYTLRDADAAAALLRLELSGADRGRKFDILVNGALLDTVDTDLAPQAGLYVREVALPPALLASAQGRLVVRFAAHAGSRAGRLYGLRLMRK